MKADKIVRNKPSSLDVRQQTIPSINHNDFSAPEENQSLSAGGNSGYLRYSLENIEFKNIDPEPKLSDHDSQANHTSESDHQPAQCILNDSIEKSKDEKSDSENNLLEFESLEKIPDDSELIKKYFDSKNHVYLDFKRLVKETCSNAEEFKLFQKLIGWDYIKKLESSYIAEVSGNSITVKLPLIGGEYNLIIHSSNNRIESMKLNSISITSQKKPNSSLPLIEEQLVGLSKLNKLYNNDRPIEYTLDATKAANVFGYNVWPKMGFDREVPFNNDFTEGIKKNEKTFEWMKKWFEDNEGLPFNFFDLFNKKDKDNETYEKLKELWRDHGEAVQGLCFDISDNSKSWDLFDQYKLENKQERLPYKMKKEMKKTLLKSKFSRFFTDLELYFDTSDK